MGKKPMAQATFSWPCGPIHLEDRRGTAQDGHFVSIFALPTDPITGVTPWTLCGPSGAQYQECLGAIPSGPTGGLSGKKIGTGAVLFLRLPLPNQCSRPPGRAVLLTDGRPQDRAARTCINSGIEGGPVCCPCGNRATSQDTPSSRAELELHQPQRRAFHR